MFTSANAKTTRLWLGYSGLIPFFALTVSSLAIDKLWPMLVFSAYSCAILSFLAGSLWGQMLLKPHAERVRLILFSNGFTLLAWVGLVLVLCHMSVLGLLLLMFGFLSLFALEHWLLFKYLSVDELVAQKNYWQMRARLTGMVALCHLIVIISIAQ